MCSEISEKLFFWDLLDGYKALIGCTCCTAEVTKVCWWMAHYGSVTPKRQWMWSNSYMVQNLDKGKLHLALWRKKNPGAPKTAKHYVKDGVKKWSGTGQLKKTEKPAFTSVTFSASYLVKMCIYSIIVCMFTFSNFLGDLAFKSSGSILWPLPESL